jgi:hypothetical protein
MLRFVRWGTVLSFAGPDDVAATPVPVCWEGSPLTLAPGLEAREARNVLAPWSGSGPGRNTQDV